ncbi:hypothetical protein ACN47E_001219 [Coniothyrium glycines]
MPNVGRPSKGCKHCRDRKVKCDQKRPACSQCIRAGKECHGYRDPLSMMFRNESDVVAKKAEKRYKELGQQKTSGLTQQEPLTLDFTGDDTISHVNDWVFTNASIVPVTGRSRYPTPESLTTELIPSIEQQAVGFFISNFVAKPSVIPRGQFEWVTELLAEPHVDNLLKESVNAVSLAGFGNATKNPIIMQKARSAYVAALRLTKDAVNNKEVALRDDTLVSVIMLGMYENMVFQDRRSIDTWAKHVAGACALIEMRGPEQFKGSVARRIFHQFYGFALLVALERGTLVHKGLHDLYEDLRPNSDYDVHGRQWTTRIVDVMHDAINLNQDKTSPPIEMLRIAMRIDRELDEVKSLMPSIWHYETMQLSEPSLHHFGNVYSIYIDPWIAQMWNNLRSCRMYLYKAVRENIKKGCAQDPPLFLPELVEPQRLAAEQVMRTTVAGIIASVPQITGMIPFPKQSDLETRNSLASGVLERAQHQLHPPGTFLDPAQSPGMMHLIWPLYAAGQSDMATYNMRDWCIEMLQFLARRLGTNQAVVLAEELKETQRAGRRSGAITNELDSVDFFFDSMMILNGDEYITMNNTFDKGWWEK